LKGLLDVLHVAQTQPFQRNSDYRPLFAPEDDFVAVDREQLRLDGKSPIPRDPLPGSGGVNRHQKSPHKQNAYEISHERPLVLDVTVIHIGSLPKFEGEVNKNTLTARLLECFFADVPGMVLSRRFESQHLSFLLPLESVPSNMHSTTGEEEHGIR